MISYNNRAPADIYANQYFSKYKRLDVIKSTIS